jgi:hypothetical protein
MRSAKILEKFTMKSLEGNFRLIVSAVLVLLVVSLAAQSSPAQSVSVSPVALPAGIPTGTTPAVSGPETVIVTISGASVGSPVTFSPSTPPTVGPSSPALGTDKPADFIIDGTSCNVTFTSANTCLVTLHFSSSLAPATTLETALLAIPYSGGITGTLTVPLSGAYGSIQLFSETNVSTPPTSTTFPGNLYTIASSTQNLSCSESPTGTLSGTPDGLGNVLVDNYITLATGAAPPLSPVTGIETNYPAGNLCSGTGATADSSGDHLYTNCFTENYDLAAIANFPSSIVGLDPDTFANAPNSVLYEGNAGGIPPISVANFLTSGSQQTLFTLLSSAEENYYSNSTLFLQTSCTTPGGVVPGATITGNPTPVNNIVFDSNPGNSCSMVTNVSQAPYASGTTPVYTLVGVPQQLFYELVQGTSSAADVCLRMSCEQDSSNNQAPMCAGVLIQCWDPTHTTLSGANCQSASTSLLRNAYDSISFDSPDIPLNGQNYLYGALLPAIDACSFYLGGTGACATGTGPGLLEGGDAWACTPGSSAPCTPQEPGAGFNTTTPASDMIYSSSAPNCAFAAGSFLAGDQCPLDIATQYIGEGDGPPGGAKAGGGGSLYFPTANHPLPTQSAAVGQYGWVNSSTANVNFTANAAVYPPVPLPEVAIPPANGFVAAPIYSVTYGITPASSPLPDTTYPVPGDLTTWNTFTNSNFGTPLCNVSGTTPSSLDPSVSAVSILSLTTSQPDGLYNLHYFATDCALTEGLIFNPSGTQLTNPTANWASFPVVPFGIDTVAPTFYPYACTPLPGNGMWYGGPSGNITVTCTVNDPPAGDGSYSGFLPLVSGIQGSASEQVLIYTNVAPGTTNASATAGAQTPGYPVGTGSTPSPLQVSDLAGNQVSGGVSASAYQIDLQAPTIVGPSLSAGPYYVGQPITVTFSCSDSGSGVFTCAGTGGVISGGTVTPGATGPYTFTVTATDNVGNQSVSSVPYTVGLEAQAITCGTVPPSSEPYNGSFPVSCTASSGLPVALTWSGSACSASSATASASITMTSGTGSCVVDANQSGNGTYSAATQVQYTVTAAKVAQTISCGTAPPSSEPYNGTFPVSCSSSSWLPVALTWSGTACSASSATTSANITMTSGTGSCVVDANQSGNGNYSAATQLQYTVNASLAAQAITFTTNAPASAANGSSFPVAASASSGLAVTLAGSGSCSGGGSGSATITMTSSSGTCTVTASQAGNGNYSPAPTLTENVTATAPPVTLTATPSSLTWGSPNPLYPGQDGNCGAFPFPLCTVTVTNSGSSSVKITSVAIGGTNSYDFGDLSFGCTGWSTKGGTLAAGKSCTILVDAWRVSAPPVTTTGPFTAQAYLAITPQGGSPIEVQLITYVINPVASFSPSKVTFPTTPKGTSSTETLTVTNTGTTPLIFGTLTIPSGATWFSIISGSDCSGQTILPGGNCVVNLKFTPTASSGTDPGSLRVPDNGLNSPQAVSLSGPI